MNGEFGAPPEEQGAYRDRAPGFVINYWLVRDSGWTNAEPKPPAKPPF